MFLIDSKFALRCGRIAITVFGIVAGGGCRRDGRPVARWAVTNEALRLEVFWPTNRLGVGERTEVRLRVHRPAGVRLNVSDPVGSSNQILILDRLVRSARRSSSYEIDDWIWRLTSFEFGRHVLWTSSLVSVVGQDHALPLPLCPATLEVGSARGDTDTDWRPLKEPARWPAAFPRWIWVLAIVAALAAGLGWLTAARRRRPPPPPPPPPPPDRVAREALNRLRLSGAIEAGEVEYLHVELSRIIREYIEARFGLHAPERTTEEFLHEAAESGTLAPPHQVLLRDMLGVCDLVKFARARPAASDMLAALDAAVKFVDETTPPPVGPETLRP